MFEGIPTWPDAGRFWEIIDKHKVTHFYTAPTAIRSLMGYGLQFVEKYELNSLKVLGSVGEPINVEAWGWYYEYIGKNRCPIVDTWWQTETGGIMISNLAGVTEAKPTFATNPLPGVFPCIVDSNGNELAGLSEGNLCIKKPWPGMARTIYGNHERYRETYFTHYPGFYFTGDGAKRDTAGHYRITGRVDDLIKVSGHLLGTAEIENALDEHPDVVEAAVVGFPHDIKGTGIYAFVILDQSNPDLHDNLKHELAMIVSDTLGPICRPDKIQIVSGLPKTRSGKIMRRILKKIAAGETSHLGDISTLLNPEIIAEIMENRA
jgi:acetyl-CoA synthetase